MPYNLLVERWLPVRRRSGRVEDIAPHQIAEVDDPPIQVASSRPDFDGALSQFLIGLVQTARTPATSQEWRKAFKTPPSPEELRREFAKYQAAFNLDGDGPRFMQDLNLTEAEASDAPPIGALLIDRMGEPGEDEPNLYRKPGGYESLGLPALAMALYTLQCNAPSGGRGHRVSLRGGGPLSVVLLGETLWQTVWLNVLGKDQFEVLANARLSRPEETFPWMGPTRTSKNGELTTTEQVHPAHLYWGMPRRVRVDFSSMAEGLCSISRHRGPVVGRYFTKDNGFNYKGSFRHPLTPYTRLTQGGVESLNSRKGSASALAYSNWPSLAGQEDEEHLPAAVVTAYLDSAHHREAQQAQQQLWVFGYSLDNMKPEGWYEGVVPLYVGGKLDPKELLGEAKRLISASDEVRATLLSQTKKAVFRRPEDIRGNFSGQLYLDFRSATEPAFFDSVAKLNQGADADSVRGAWLQTLHEAARRVFQTHSQLNAGMEALDIGRVARAWNALVRFTHPNTKKLRDAVGLPPFERPAKKSEPKEVNP